jgi:hypothetical protein
LVIALLCTTFVLTLPPLPQEKSPIPNPYWKIGAKTEDRMKHIFQYGIELSLSFSALLSCLSKGGFVNILTKCLLLCLHVFVLYYPCRSAAWLGGRIGLLYFAPSLHVFLETGPRENSACNIFPLIKYLIQSCPLQRAHYQI